MKKQIFMELIRDFETHKLPELIRRERIIKVPTANKAIAFIGPRRSGKTFLCYDIIGGLLDEGVPRERILYINLEDDRLFPLELPDLDGLLRTYFELHPENTSKRVHLFLDEVQVVDGWERFVRRILDSENIQVYLTGSSSKMLSSEIATTMRGRSISFLILPFSFREFLVAKGFHTEAHMPSAKKAQLLSHLSDFARSGGFPEIVLERDPDLVTRLLGDYREVMLFRDIVERFNVKNSGILKSLFHTMISSTSSAFSINKFHNTLKSRGQNIGKNTIYDYAGYLEDTYAILLIRSFDYSLRKREQSLPKPYPIDPGFLRLQGPMVSDNAGVAMETIVAVELLRLCAEKPTLDFHYWKGTYQREVDFVITRDTDVSALVQVCYDLEDEDTEGREVRSLLNAGKALSCDNMFILSWDEERTVEVSGKEIHVLPVWKWLLDPSVIPL
jgi:uncharacterized protein